MARYTVPGLRLGTTSFLSSLGYVDGFRLAAQFCEDVSLLLICLGEHGEELPTAADVREIAAVADGENVSVNIHLPCDHHMETPASCQAMVDDIATVMERIAPLSPHTFVLHVYFPTLDSVLLGPNLDDLELQAEQVACARAALEQITKLLPSPESLAVENLESFPPTFWDPFLEDAPWSRCADLGHLWRDGWDAGPFLEDWLPKTRLIHLHGLEPRPDSKAPFKVRTRRLPMTEERTLLFNMFGIYPRDHKSLRAMPVYLVDHVLHRLWDANWQGVVNLEQFSVPDLVDSVDVLLESRRRYDRAQEGKGR